MATKKSISLRGSLRVFAGLVLLLSWAPLAAQNEPAADPISALSDRLERENDAMGHRLDELERRVDDLAFLLRLGELAEIDMVRIAGPPLRHQPNPTAQGAGNPFLFVSYTFIPKDLDRSKKQPLLVFPHGGVHSNFGTGYVNILRELLVQGYTIVAPEYRGSTGYGRGVYRAIDYGGLEIEDTWAARSFMLDTYDFLDPKRVGILGWSHGGLHALMNIFDHPGGYAVAFAGVPVSDLVARMGYKTQGYRDLFSAEHHIGKSAYEDVAEYRKRSPSWNTDKYDGTPLLVYTNTNDEDVNVLEVERLIQALQAGGKQGFEYKIFQDEPGGHAFDRLDLPRAKEIRRDIWRFLARVLKPDRAVR